MLSNMREEEGKSCKINIFRFVQTHPNDLLNELLPALDQLLAGYGCGRVPSKLYQRAVVHKILAGFNPKVNIFPFTGNSGGSLLGP